jgi:hypothetical protein
VRDKVRERARGTAGILLHNHDNRVHNMSVCQSVSPNEHKCQSKGLDSSGIISNSDEWRSLGSQAINHLTQTIRLGRKVRLDDDGARISTLCM